MLGEATLDSTGDCGGLMGTLGPMSSTLGSAGSCREDRPEEVPATSSSSAGSRKEPCGTDGASGEEGPRTDHTEEVTTRVPGSQSEDAASQSPAQRPPSPLTRTPTPPQEMAPGWVESPKGAKEGVEALQESGDWPRQSRQSHSEPVAVLAIPSELDAPPAMGTPREDDDMVPEEPEVEETKGRVATFRGGLERFRTGCPKALLKLLVRRPLTMFLVMQVLVGALCCALFKGGALNTDFDSFIQASSPSSLNRDAYTHAWTVSSYAPSTSRRLQEEDIFYSHDIVHVIYHQEGGENMLAEERLFAVRQFEQKLQALPEWRSACRWSPSAPAAESLSDHLAGVTAAPQEMRPSCDPGESLVSYVWPERLAAHPGVNGSVLSGQTGNVALRLGGHGSRRFPVEAALASFREEGRAGQHDRLRRFLPVDFSLPEGGAKAHSELLQSHFLFSEAYGPEGSGVAHRNYRSAHDAFINFLADTLHPALLDGDEALEALGVRIYYYSSTLDRLDIFHALWTDCRLALGGLVVVCAIVRLHTQSWLLSLAGLLLVLESIPLGYVLFKHLSGVQDMSVVNCLSLFVIIGIGSDLLFVLTDGWRHSMSLPAEALKTTDSVEASPLATPQQPVTHQLSQRQRMLCRRLLWLWKNSGTSCMTTTVCSATSFLVNLGSVLAPLREFGLFMGLCVVSSFILETSMYPLLLMAVDRNHSARRPHSLDMNAVVPYGDAAPVAQESMVRQGSMEAIRDRSFIVRFLGRGWAKFLRRQRRKVVAAFFFCLLICIISIPLSISVDSGMPGVFPSSHNQVAGKLLKGRFDPNMVQLAVHSSNYQAWVCDVHSPRREDECRDTDDSCGTWSSTGLCSSHASTMHSYCRQSCGFCEYCLARWCLVQAPPQTSRPTHGRCECSIDNSTLVSPVQLQQGEAVVTRVEAMIVGFGADAWQELEPHFTPYFGELATVPNTQLTHSYDSTEAGQQPPLVQEHWRSGSFAAWPYLEAPAFTGTARNMAVPGGRVVLERTVRPFCYCDGISPCAATAGSTTVVQHPLRRLEGQPGDQAEASAVALERESPAGRLQESVLRPLWPAAPSRRLAPSPASVNVIHGLEVLPPGIFELFVQTAKEQIWRFDEMFEPADPWAQRSMMRMSETLPATLRVTNSAPVGTSWLAGFEEWLLRVVGQTFPARDFHTLANEFVTSNPMYAKHLLRDPGDGRVRAVRSEFRLELEQGAALGPALDAMRAWDEHVALQNAAASIRAGRAWHTSALWVRAEAQHGIISSTATIILISVGVGFLAMLFFTRNLVLALLSMLSVLLIVVSLLFFMVCVMSWDVGAIEVVALIVFLGYIFTFNLHIAHSYSHAVVQSAGNSHASQGVDLVSIKRFQMARYALVTMGQSLIGSATTSVGCSLFLVFCTLQFFVKFGLVILLVTILSLVYSLAFLPAILMICGPVGSGCCRERLASTGVEGPGDAISGEVDPPQPLLAESQAFEAERGPSGEAKQPQPLAGPLQSEGPRDLSPASSPRLNAATEEEEV